MTVDVGDTLSAIATDRGSAAREAEIAAVCEAVRRIATSRDDAIQPGNAPAAAVAALAQRVSALEARAGALPDQPRPVPGPARDARPLAGLSLDARVRECLPMLHGWCSETKALWLADTIMQNRMERIVEVGIFGGKSLFPMALALQELGRGHVYGIEPWDAGIATERPTNEVNDRWWKAVDLQAVKASFHRHMLAWGLTDRIRVLEVPSDSAYAALSSKRFVGTVDLVHIDGSHAEDQALQDVQTWSRIIRPGGLLVVDDIGWESVQAAREYVREHFETVRETFEGASTGFGAYRIGAA